MFLRTAKLDEYRSLRARREAAQAEAHQEDNLHKKEGIRGLQRWLAAQETEMWNEALKELTR